MTLIAPSRRGFLAGMLAFAAAPAIVRTSSLMPVKAAIDKAALNASLMDALGPSWSTAGQFVAYSPRYYSFDCELWFAACRSNVTAAVQRAYAEADVPKGLFA